MRKNPYFVPRGIYKVVSVRDTLISVLKSERASNFSLECFLFHVPMLFMAGKIMFLVANW